jgi:hypothetical protein
VAYRTTTSYLVAIGNSAAQVQYSADDGATWNAATVPSGMTAPIAVTANDSLFVIVDGGTKRVSTSPDGATWTAQTPDGDGSDGFADVKWSQALGLFFALTKSSGSGLGYLQTSPDGITWTLYGNGLGLLFNPRALACTRYGVVILGNGNGGGIQGFITLDGVTVESFGTFGLPDVALGPASVIVCENPFAFSADADRYTVIMFQGANAATAFRSAVMVNGVT